MTPKLTPEQLARFREKARYCIGYEEVNVAAGDLQALLDERDQLEKDRDEWKEQAEYLENAALETSL